MPPTNKIGFPELYMRHQLHQQQCQCQAKQLAASDPSHPTKQSKKWQFHDESVDGPAWRMVTILAVKLAVNYSICFILPISLFNNPFLVHHTFSRP
jgi:hypothetical protein